ncbi:hypothetical protein ESA_00196 [Cronobacter sakazakii ATCC BAA-894]|uniref:Uncharacterized protein n=1 Tax=Cronobacter sakazakii (strain ATCC BAA-894) TaxID=290339 RepID=A7MM87_CROS8|nr:hypothetical protein ESA_00196 [Cronobacter sakazakii ATCC BAA-894]
MGKCNYLFQSILIWIMARPNKNQNLAKERSTIDNCLHVPVIGPLIFMHLNNSIIRRALFVRFIGDDFFNLLRRAGNIVYRNDANFI